MGTDVKREITGADEVPTELTQFAESILSDIGLSNIFLFGGFPRASTEDAPRNALQKWILACRFDWCLRLWHPAVQETLEQITEGHHVKDHRAAESAWLECVWLWPDAESQENAADELWAMDSATGAPSEKAIREKIKIREAQGRMQRAQMKSRWDAKKKEWVWTRRLRINVALRKRAQAALRNRRLRQRAALDGDRCHPELWLRYVACSAKSRATSGRKNWRVWARDELAKAVPAASGHELDFDKIACALVFAKCYGWADHNKEIAKRLCPDSFSLSEKASELTFGALKSAQYKNTPSPRSIRRIIERANLLKSIRYWRQS